MNVNDYLLRIGLDPQTVTKPDSETLRRLQFAHCTTVPYENADVIRGKTISLKTEDLYDKIVTRRRGGYCFELNGLFGWLLRELGYGVFDYAARYLRGESAIPMRRHRVLKVIATDGTWLCDVGVGEVCPRYPLRLKERLVQPQFNEAYRFERDAKLGWVLMDLHEGEWRPFYSFTEDEWLNQDFVAIAYYCDKSPDSPFTKKEMFMVKTGDGRVSLDGNILKIIQNGNCQVKEFSPEKMPEAYSYFGLKYEE